MTNTHQQWRLLKRSIVQLPSCSLILEECLRAKTGNPVLPPREPHATHRLTESFLTYAVNIEHSQLEMHSTFEQVVLLTLLNNPNFAKDTLVQLHKLLSSGAQYQNFYIAPTLIPYEIEDILQSKHFHVYFWEKKVNALHPLHPYRLSLEKTITMLACIQARIGFGNVYHTRFFSRLTWYKNNIMKAIDL